MHKNPLWIAFFTLILLVALFFLFKAGAQLISYFRLSETTSAQIEKVEVVQQSKGRYILWVTAKYQVLDKEITSSQMAAGPFLNQFTAEEKAKALREKTTIQVWYSPHDPDQFVINKQFPTKGVVSAAILVFIALYFFFLGRYVRKRNYHH